MRLFKKPAGKPAVDESTGGVFFSPAHPKLPRQLVLREGYVEDTFKAKMPLAGFFNSLSVD